MGARTAVQLQGGETCACGGGDGAEEKHVVGVFYVLVAKAQAVRAQPLRPLLALPAPRLLSAPVGAGAELRQRLPLAPAWECQVGCRAVLLRRQLTAADCHVVLQCSLSLSLSHLLLSHQMCPFFCV